MITKEEYAAITSCPAYKDLMVVLTDHIPKNRDKWVGRILWDLRCGNFEEVDELEYYYKHGECYERKSLEVPIEAVRFIVEDCCNTAALL